MSTTAKGFWLLVLAQAGFLLAWAGYHEWVRQNAPVILLKCRPVDPQDLLRGDYMTLDYDISHPATIGGKADVPHRGSLWVTLEKQDRYHAVVSVSDKRQAPGPGQVLVRGERAGLWVTGTDGRRIDYGIDRYFVPEGKGSPRFTLAEVEASVSPAHRLYIRRVLLDGKSYP